MSDLTIRDIAKIAGVSTTAVSFVLNNRPGVSDATRQHVQEVIARTGFTPNVHTRRLNLGRSFSVHVVLYWHEHDLFNQFALEILHGVFQSCKQLGYSVVFTFVEKNMDCSQLMASIRSKDCDGVILSQIEDPLFITLLQQEHIPFVCVDSHVRRDGTLPLVEVDYYKAAYDSVMYLRRCGHTKIGYIAPTIPLELHLSTFSGYTNALRDCSLTCDPAWIGNIAFEPDAAGLYFEQLLQTGHLPTAFLCTGDPFAIDLIRRMKRAFRKKPNIHICGYIDNISAMMDSADLFLTKPGGISTSEAMVKGLPMVLVNVVGGCETPNLEFFVSHGGAATADTPEAIAALCKRLLEHDEERLIMRQSLLAMHKTPAAQAICDCLEA